jgi:hypothetical protein
VKRHAGDFFAAIFLVAVLYMLVRPSSPGPALIQAVTGAFTDLVALATSA